MSEPDPPGPIGFIGLGDMGGPIAERLVEARFKVTVADLRTDAVDQLVAKGAAAAPSLADIAAGSAILFICVVNDQQVASLVRQVGPSLAPGSTVVILSSVKPETMAVVRGLLDDSGRETVDLVDIPVSGSRPAAAAGTLTLMVGGSDASVDLLRPVLASFSERIFHVGPLGSGQAMKIANNIVLHMNHLVALEAVRFARSQGIDEERFIEVVNVSSGRSWVTETWGLIDGMFRDHPQAGTDGIYAMMVKEMWSAVLISRGSDCALPLTGLGLQVSREAYAGRERDLGIKRPRAEGRARRAAARTGRPDKVIS